MNYVVHWFLDSLMRKNGVLGHRSAWAWRSPWWPRPALQVIHVHALQKRTIILIKTQINHGDSVRKIGLYYKIAVQGVWGGQWCLASHCQVQTSLSIVMRFEANQSISGRKWEIYCRTNFDLFLLEEPYLAMVRRVVEAMMTLDMDSGDTTLWFRDC